MVVCCSGLILLNVTISKVLFAKDFFDAWEYAPVLIFAMLFSGLSSFWGGIFNAVKRNEVIAWTTVTAGIINCVFNALLIPVIGIMGAAIATLISFYSMWILRYFAARRYIECRNNFVKHHIMYLLIMVQIFFDHQGHLEGDGVVKLPQVQAGELLDLLQPVHQGIAVDEQLPGSLGHVQVVFKELVDGEQSLLVQSVDGVLLKDLLEEHLAQDGSS